MRHPLELRMRANQVLAADSKEARLERARDRFLENERFSQYCEDCSERSAYAETETGTLLCRICFSESTTDGLPECAVELAKLVLKELGVSDGRAEVQS